MRAGFMSTMSFRPYRSEPEICVQRESRREALGDIQSNRIKGNAMQKNLMIVTLVALVLSACSSTGILQSTQPENKISGTVTRGFLQPYQVDVTLDGKVYRGEWRTEAPTPMQKATTGLPHKYHVGKVRSTLRADDGSELNCQWLTHSQTADGSCRTGGREYPLTMK